MFRTLSIKRLLVLALPLCSLIPSSAHASGNKVLLIILDGLRPDYVTPKRMPNLYAWGREGVVFEKHHATFPTVTRVNASSIVTGAYPAQHGIVDNSVYFPGLEPGKTLSTSSRGSLERIEAYTGGHLLTVPTLGEWLAQHNLKTGVFSSGSQGSAFLLNHKVANGFIVNTGYILPESLATTLGPIMGNPPPDAAPNTARNNRIVRAYLDYGLNNLRAELTIIWLSDPDHTAHEYGMDSPKTTMALKGVDDALGQIAATLAEQGMLGHTNIIVSSDHGFSTHTLKIDPRQVLRDFTQEHQLADNDIIVTGRCIYLRDVAKPLLPALVERLQRTNWVGALFTRARTPGSMEGIVAGTLSLDLIHENHPERAPDIVLSPEWTNDKTGSFKGTVLTSGVAGHGSASPWDIHNTLIAWGPAFAQGRLVGIPTHNTDLAPTICHLLGIKAPPTMQGRILYEGLKAAAPEPPEAVGHRTFWSSRQFTDGMRYIMEVDVSTYRGHTYLDQAVAVRNTP